MARKNIVAYEKQNNLTVSVNPCPRWLKMWGSKFIVDLRTNNEGTLNIPVCNYVCSSQRNTLYAHVYKLELLQYRHSSVLKYAEVYICKYLNTDSLQCIGSGVKQWIWRGFLKSGVLNLVHFGLTTWIKSEQTSDCSQWLRGFRVRLNEYKTQIDYPPPPPRLDTNGQSVIKQALMNATSCSLAKN